MTPDTPRPSKRVLGQRRAIAVSPNSPWVITCKYHPERPATKRLISWVDTSSVHAYPIDHGACCQECIDEALRRAPRHATWRFLTDPLPQAY